MKTWILALALTLFATLSWADDPQAVFDKAWAASFQKAVEKWPEAANPESNISKIANSLQLEYQSSSDPAKKAIYITPDSAYHYYEQAAAKLAFPDASWKKAVKAASSDLPDLADPNSELSRSTEQLRQEYFKSTDPVKLQAAKDDAALYIASEAASQLETERRNSVQKEVVAEATQVEKAPTKAEFLALKEQLLDTQAKLINAEFLLSHNKELVEKWKKIANDALAKSQEWKDEATRLEMVAESNYEGAEEWKKEAELFQQVSEKWKMMANQNTSQRSSRASGPVTVIKTADGHWQTSDGTQVIEAAPGHFIINR